MLEYFLPNSLQIHPTLPTIPQFSHDPTAGSLLVFIVAYRDSLCLLIKHMIDGGVYHVLSVPETGRLYSGVSRLRLWSCSIR